MVVAVGAAPHTLRGRDFVARLRSVFTHSPPGSRSCLHPAVLLCSMVRFAVRVMNSLLPPSRPSLLRLWYVPTLGRTKRWVRRRPADTVLKSRSSWLAVCLPSTEVPLPTSACAEENVESFGVNYGDSRREAIAQ